MKLLTIKPTMNNTTRFKVAGFNGLYRKRVLKSRWGVTSGDTFKQVHFGKRTIGLELRNPIRNLFNW